MTKGAPSGRFAGAPRGRFAVLQRTGKHTTVVVSRHHRLDRADATIEAALEGDACEMYVLDTRTGLPVEREKVYE